MRYFLELAYKGTAYHGWQRQPNAITVQEVLEEALSTLLRCPIVLVGAGRTDAGVHARQLFAHFDVEEPLEASLCDRLNGFLPSDIVVKSLKRVEEEAHARFDALSRTYEYHICRSKDPFLINSAYLFTHSLDIPLMNTASNELLKYHDFKSFSRSGTDVKTYLCDLRKASWEQQTGLLVFTVTADRFLRNMVRAMVGTLIDVGLRKLSLEDMGRILESGDRSLAGASVPAHGLYLAEVIYPDTIWQHG